jgi:HPt (histidine-containing phosphotransfer) domain-containing protein
MVRATVDLEHLRRYTDGDRELERALVEAFGESCDQYLPGLDPVAPVSQWRGAAHGLKGAARGIGAFTLGDLAEAAEGLSATEERRALLVRLLDEVAAVRRALGALQ